MIPTPTFMPTPFPATPQFSLGVLQDGVNITFAQDLVAGYNYFNSGFPVLEIVFTVVMILLIIGGAFWVIRALQDLNDD